MMSFHAWLAECRQRAKESLVASCGPITIKPIAVLLKQRAESTTTSGGKTAPAVSQQRPITRSQQANWPKTTTIVLL